MKLLNIKSNPRGLMTCHRVVFHSDAPSHAPPLSWHPLSFLPGGIGDNHVPLHGTLLRVPLLWTSLYRCCSDPSADTMEHVKTAVCLFPGRCSRTAAPTQVLMP